MGFENSAKCFLSFVFVWIYYINQVSGEVCKVYGHHCNAPSRCCGSRCCTDQDYEVPVVTYYRWNLWNMWYFWFIIVFILMSCFGGCGYYKRRQMLFSRRGVPSTTPTRAPRRGTAVPIIFAEPAYPNAYPNAYAYSGPGSEPQGGYFMAPPAYSEVVSHPTLYPVNKSELPPYPGGNPAQTGMVEGSQQQPVGGGVFCNPTLPQLPPYSSVVPGASQPNTASGTTPTNTAAPPTGNTHPDTATASIPREAA